MNLPIAVSVQNSPEGFEHAVLVMAPVLSALAAELGCPPASVTVVLAEDFGGEIEATWRRAGIDGLEFTGERLGGLVRAKTMAITPDYAQVHIVFNGADWPSEPDIGQVLEWHYVIAHELTHVVLGRLRHASGAADGVPARSFTPSECARSIARIAIEEFRCDFIADLIIRKVMHVEQDGERQDIGLIDIFGGGYAATVHALMDERVYPGWPDVIEQYRSRQIDLQTMWGTIVRETDQMMTAIAHAEAEVCSEGAGALLGQERFEEMPGASLYLASAWGPILEVVNGSDVLPHLTAYAEIDRQIANAGEASILAMWETLGITHTETSEGEFHLHVTDPVR